MKGQISEKKAQAWHDAKIGISHTRCIDPLSIIFSCAYSRLYLRFLLVVLSAYKQMQQQSRPVLADIDEDNFDKAFSLFRPGMQHFLIT